MMLKAVMNIHYYMMHCMAGLCFVQQRVSHLSKGILQGPVQVALDVASQRASDALIQSMLLTKACCCRLHDSTHVVIYAF